MNSKRIVLFIDDDQSTLSSVRRALIDEPYELITLDQPQKVLEIMAQHDISVIITDMMMPGMDGLNLLNMVKEKYPGAIRMLISGHADINGLLEAINKNIIYKFITKPVNDDDLKSIVHQGIEYYNLRHERDLLLAQVGQRGPEKRTIE